MNANLIAALSRLPAIVAAHGTVKYQTTTFNDIVGKMGACSDGQGNLKSGFKAHYGRDLKPDEPLTPGQIEISANRYGMNWVFRQYSDWREESNRKPLTLAWMNAFEAAVAACGRPVPSAAAYLAIGRSYASGELSLNAAKEAGQRLPAGGDDQYARYMLEGILTNATDNHLLVFKRLLELNNNDARHLLAAALLLTGAEAYDCPALPIFDGARLKFGELIFEVTFNGSTPSLAVVPYRRPEAGQKWKDAAGAEYLILADVTQAVNMKTGALLDLDAEQQIPGTVRGVSWTLAQ